MVEVQYLAQRSCEQSQRPKSREFQGVEGLPTCRSLSVCWWATMIGGKCLRRRKVTEDINQTRRFRHASFELAPSFYTVVKIEGGLRTTSTY